MHLLLLLFKTVVGEIILINLLARNVSKASDITFAMSAQIVCNLYFVLYLVLGYFEEDCVILKFCMCLKFAIY